MNRRHALLKAIKKTWWSFLCAIVIVGALVYIWMIGAAPWWFMTSTSFVVASLCGLELVDNVHKVRRDHFEI